MNRDALQAMSTRELWILYQKVDEILGAKIEAQQLRRTQGLERPPAVPKIGSRRPYPKVRPKFRNPLDPTKMWSGRGKRPRWFTKMLEVGESIDDLRILETT